MSSQNHSPNPNGGALPAMPAPILRPSEDSPRISEDTMNKPLLRQSYQSTATVRNSAQTDNTIRERPSDEMSTRPNSARRQAHSQLTAWQPPPQTESPQDMSRLSQDQRPAGPSTYARSTSNDYTVYGGVETPTPVNPSQLPGSESSSYFRHPYRRAGAAPSVRETAETGSLKGGRYTPLASGHKAKQSNGGLNRAHWPDGYDASNDPYDEATPPRPKPQKKRTSVYIVREGEGNGDGSGGSPPPEEVMRLPFANFMAGTVRNHFVAVLGEFVGTTMFLFFAFAGTLVANIGATESAGNTTTNDTVGFSPIVLMYVAVSFGFSLMVNVWIFFRVSGGLFNPAVTLGMVMVKAITYVRGFLLVGAQLTGAILASFLVQVLFPSQFNVRTTLAANTSVTRGVFIEAILTAQLVFTVFMLAKEKHKATYMAPVGIGLALFVAELVGVFFTGGSLNPARSFGPCVTTGSFDAEHWIYWVGPAMGAVAAYAFYRFIKILEYEVANPGQDDSAEEAEAASLRGKREKEENGLV